MFEQLPTSIRGLILDMDGVLWKDDSAIGNLPAVFGRIRARGLKVALATNNATKTVDEYLSKLRRFGVDLESWQVITSSEATAQALVEAHPQKGAVFVIGEGGLTAAIYAAGFTPIVDPDDTTRPVAVAAGMDRSLTFSKLRRAALHIQAGVPFYATNPDKTFPTPEGLIPGAGSILAALEAATNVQPVVIGKPAPFMFKLAAERLGIGKDELLVIGDRLETDIAGGQALGSRTGLVLSGVSTREQADRWRPKPDLVAEDLTSLVGP